MTQHAAGSGTKSSSFAEMLQSRVTQYFKSEQLRLPFSSTTVPSYAQDIWAQPQLVQHASLRTAVDALANAWKRLLPHAEDALSKLYTAPLEPLNIAAPEVAPR